MTKQIGWKVAYLTEVAELIRGTEPGRHSYCGQAIGVRFLRVGDISGKSEEHVNTTSKDIVICKEDDILMSFDGTPGVVARGLEGAISPRIRIVKPNRNLIQPNYIYHYLQTERVQKIVKKYTVNQNIAHASRSIPYFEIIFPSDIRIQEKYATILDKIETIRFKRERTIQLASRWIQSLLVKKFGDPVMNPKNLPMSKIKDLLQSGKYSIKSGPFGSQLLQTELRSEGIRVSYPEDISKGKISNNNAKFISAEKYDKLNGFTVGPGDVLISLMGTLGRVAVIPESIPQSIISKHLMKITLDPEKCSPEFLKFILQNPTMNEQIKLLSLGQTQKGLNTSIVKRILVPIPKLNEQEEFVKAAMKMDNYLELTKIAFERYKQLYQTSIGNLILNNVISNTTIRSEQKLESYLN